MPLRTSFICASSFSNAERRVSVESMGLEVVSMKVKVLIEGNPPASIDLINMVSESASNRATVEPGDRG